MPPIYRPILLVLHHDNQVLRQIAKMTSEVAELVVARSAAHANLVLKNAHQINVVIVGRSSDGFGAGHPCAARSARPQARTILLGDSSDLSLSIEALHSGIVDHVISPPLRERELLAIVRMPSPRPLIEAPSSCAGRCSCQAHLIHRGTREEHREKPTLHLSPRSWRAPLMNNR